MSTALFLIAMTAMLLLVFWLFQNDRGDPDSGYKGIFAMRRKHVEEKPRDAEGAPSLPRWRRG